MIDELAHTYMSGQDVSWNVATADPEALGRALQAITHEARRRWPKVEVDPVAFSRFLADRAPDRMDPLQSLGAMATTDLYLAHGCLSHDAAALAAFETSVMSGVAPAVGRIDGSELFADEVREEVRVKLLAPTDGGPPRLGSYLGRGPLRSWVQVAAIRTAYSLKRLKPKDTPEDIARLAAFPFEGDDAEIAQIRKQFGPAFARAFKGALKSLAPRDRNVLRLYILEGLNSETIGRMYRVHRATVARWIAKAQEDLLKATRKQLERELGIDAGEFESLMRLLRSQLDVSIVSALTP